MLIKTDRAIIEGYLEDASGFTRGSAERIAIPENETELAEFLRSASQNQQPVTIAGARTGVAAGCIPEGGTLLSLERLEKIGQVIKTPEGGKIIAQPGVRLERLKSTAQAAGLIYGPDPTERTGSLGGNVATNASGGQCFKYGTTREHVLGLRAVLSTGDIISLQRGQSFSPANNLVFPLLSGKTLTCPRPQLPDLRVHKNSAGYFSKPNMDPLDLLIGMEGTLGVITELTLRLLPAPGGIFTLAIFFSQVEAALECSALIRDSSLGTTPIPGIAPASLEFMNEQSLSLLRPSFSSLPANARAVLLVEQEHATNQEEAALQHWSNFMARQNVPENMLWFAQTFQDRDRLRAFRHALPEAVNSIVRSRKLQKVGTDMAVPAPEFSRMYAVYSQGLKKLGLDSLIFGHIGECHLHVNVLPKDQAEFARAKELYLEFARQAVAFGGTVSAEHGIGKIKHDFLQVMVGDEGFREMARVKRRFDPALILNRGNVFPEKYLQE